MAGSTETTVLLMALEGHEDEDKAVSRRFDQCAGILGRLATWKRILVPSRGSYEYARVLQAEWRQMDIVTWEHDNLPTVEDARAILTCPYRLCAADYQLAGYHRGNRDLKGLEIELGRSRSTGHVLARIHQDPIGEFCDMAGFGFSKIGMEVQRQVPIGHWNWRTLDSVWNAEAHKLGYKWHTHPEVVHLHRYAPTYTRLAPDLFDLG